MYSVYKVDIKLNQAHWEPHTHNLRLMILFLVGGNVGSSADMLEALRPRGEEIRHSQSSEGTRRLCRCRITSSHTQPTPS